MNTFAFTTVDFIVLGIIFFSAIVGLVRGFVREALSLIGFALAMYLSFRYSGLVGGRWVAEMVNGGTSQLVIAFILIFLVTLIASKLITHFFNQLVSKIGLSFLDRLLGSVFGILRGVLIIMVLSTLFALTDIPKSAEWKDALTRPAVDFTVSVIHSWLPIDWANRLKDAIDIRKAP